MMFGAKKLRQSLVDELLQLGYPDVFRRIQEKNVSWMIASNCQQVSKHLLKLPNFPRERYLPLWQCNGNTLVYFDKQEQAYFEWFFEDESPTMDCRTCRETPSHERDNIQV